MEKKRRRDREYYKKHYQENKEKYKAKSRKQYQKNKERYHRFRKEVINILGNGCIMCGENRYVCLDIHHTDESTKPEVWKERKSGSSGKIKMIRMFKEWVEGGVPDDIVVLCANCHRIIHSSN